LPEPPDDEPPVEPLEPLEPEEPPVEPEDPGELIPLLPEEPLPEVPEEPEEPLLPLLAPAPVSAERRSQPVFRTAPSKPSARIAFDVFENWFIFYIPFSKD